MNGSFDPLNLVLLVVAVVVLWKLKSVLGQRTGNERAPDPLPTWKSSDKPESRAPANGNEAPPPNAADDEVEPVAPVWFGYAKEGSDQAAALEKIALAMPDFKVATFIGGAKLAYEMIVEAYAKGDRAALKPLLSTETFDGFSAGIDRRQKAGETVALQFVGIDRVDLHDARLDGNMAAISLRIASEMITATRDRAGAVIDGDPKAVKDIVDIWTFERDVTSRNPNWKLAATDDPLE